MPRPEGQELDLRVWGRLCGTALGVRLFLRWIVVKSNDVPVFPDRQWTGHPRPFSKSQSERRLAT